MRIKLPFEMNIPITGEASVEIDKTMKEVFYFIGERFFDNYPKWAQEVIGFEALDGVEARIGAKAKQIRQEPDGTTESIFEIIEYQPYVTVVFQGIRDPYKHHYQLHGQETEKPTKLTFRFELLELDVFMRPFEKLIRYAIEEGAENTVENIKNLIAAEC